MLRFRWHVSARSARHAAAWVTLAFLAGITAVVSYLHALWVVRAVGNTGLIAYLIPFVPDLMIVTSSLTLIDTIGDGVRGKARLARDGWSYASLGIGAIVTVVTNVAAGLKWVPPYGGAVVAGLIPVAFMLTFETVLVRLRQADNSVPEVENFSTSSVPEMGVPRPLVGKVPPTAFDAAAARLRFAAEHGFKITDTELRDSYLLTRLDVAKVRQLVAAESNGHGGIDPD